MLTIALESILNRLVLLSSFLSSLALILAKIASVSGSFFGVYFLPHFAVGIPSDLESLPLCLQKVFPYH